MIYALVAVLMGCLCAFGIYRPGMWKLNIALLGFSCGFNAALAMTEFWP